MVVVFGTKISYEMLIIMGYSAHQYDLWVKGLGNINLKHRSKRSMSHILEKVSDYDQETPKSQTADPSRHREEEPQDIYSNKTSKNKTPM